MIDLMYMRNLFNTILFTLLLLAVTACETFFEVPFVALKASFTPSKTLVQVGDTILFVQQSTVSNRFQWNFGDATISTEANPIKIYQNNGRFNVKLVAIKDDGFTKDSLTRSILVLPRTLANKDTTTIGVAAADEVGFAIAPIFDASNIGIGFLLVSRENLNTLVLTRTSTDFIPQEVIKFSNFGQGILYPKSLIQTADGGFVIVGYFGYNTNENDSFILKIDKNGSEEWRVINATGRDEVYQSIARVNNSLVVAGTVGEFDSFGSKKSKILLDFYSPNGVLQSTNQFGNNWTLQEMLFSSRGEYIIAITEGDKPSLLQFNSSFELQFKLSMPFKGKGVGVNQLSSGDFILVGEKEHRPDSSTAFIAKINQFGAIDWVKDQNAYYKESLIDAIEIDKAIYTFGTHYNPITKKDILVMKYSEQGELLKMRLIGGKKDDEAFDIQKTLDNRFYMLGSTQNFGAGKNQGTFNIYTIQLDAELE